MSRFHTLSPDEFEELVGDALAEAVGGRYEIFARGRDGGVDLRRRDDAGSLEVVQVKHYERSSFSSLTAAARRERQSLATLDPQPNIYRFVTSIDLTPSRKSILERELAPYVTEPSQIMGLRDLESLLRSYPRVEHRHPKLWLSSGTHLLDLINAGVRDRSRALVADIQESLHTYVRHSRFDEARARLFSGKVLIIAGVPGVGKTTLARMLLTEALQEGFDEPLSISRHPDEIRNVLDVRRRQVIYYDDFLGRTALSRLDKNQDRELAALIRQVIRAPHTLFVLTTREYILRHAVQLHEELRHSNIESQRYLLHLTHYSYLDRARIFISHAGTSRAIPERAARALLCDSAYDRIIAHPNYNPRTIAYITGTAGPSLAFDDADDYLDFAVSRLDDPTLLWQQAFSYELGAAEQALLLAMASVPTRVREDDLRRLFAPLARSLGAPASDESFMGALISLEDSMVKVNESFGDLFVQARDPSVEDFIKTHVAGDLDHALAIASAAQAFEQVSWLATQLGRRLADLTPGITAAFERTYLAEPVTWAGIWYEYDFSLARVERNLPRRLEIVCKAMLEDPAFARSAETWFREELTRMLESLDELPHDQLYDFVALINTARATVHEIVGGREMVVKFMTSDLTSAERWGALGSLQASSPELLVDVDGPELRRSALRWLDSALTNVGAYSSADELDAVVYAAKRLNIDLVDHIVEEIREDVIEEHGSPEAVLDGPPDDLFDDARPTEEERAKVDAAFRRFVADIADQHSREV